jgi:cytochrome c-type protein NapC
MGESRFKSWLKGLLQPSAKYSVLTLVVIGLVLGVGGLMAFDYTMHATSTEKFCTSCHAMAENPYAQLQKTTHYTNPSGVKATCSDCHVPKEFVPKMIRKVQASREVWGAITGIIDTPEKYAAHAPVMKAREIARIKANDSQECRNCHDEDRMLLPVQTAKAQQFHKNMMDGSKTCIDCHTGVGHPQNLAGLNGATYE